MTTELEHDIRSALHDRVEHVTPDRLRHLDEPRALKHRAQHTRWAIIGPIAAAACVALIAVAITVAVSGGDTKGRPAGGQPGSLNSLIGTSWSLVSVREDSHATVAIPQRLGAGIAFERGPVFDAQDGVNNYQATYKLSTTGDLLISGDVVGTAAGYAGHDPATLAAIKAISAILYAGNGQTTPHPVSLQHSPDHLELTANGYTLVLNGEVPVATSSAPPPSSTSHR